jgi:hypothetical protein
LYLVVIVEAKQRKDNTMAEVELTEGTLLIHVRALDRLWALKSRLEIPLPHVLGAEVNPEAALPSWWKSPSPTATQLPGVVTAGTFYQDGQMVFWDVHHPEKALIIWLRDERYQRLVIEVDDPPATAAAIQGAIGEG